MTFVQVEFLGFMLVVLALYWGFQLLGHAPLRSRTFALGKLFGQSGEAWERRHDDLPRQLQNIMLWIASNVFYGWIHPWFLILLYISATVDYFAARAIEGNPQHKRWLLAISMASNLTMLGFFKYWNFFVENFSAALGSLGVHPDLFVLHVLLPVGISFYTFQTMSYTIDVYRGQLKARTNYIDYALYVSFFPQLVAGPIERASALLPQVERKRHFDLDRFLMGFGLALWGGFKKVVIADTLAPYVDEIFMTKNPAFLMVLAAGFAFGVQMLADFAAYTDIARGVARMLGFELMENFNRPYSALSTPEFWRKWHISLSSWVGDYVYTPLLRTGKPSWWRTVGAIMVTFFCVGLWHGASWNFILLGLYNGFWMVFYTFVTPLVPRRLRENLPAQFVAWVFHTLVVLQPTGLLFREHSLTRVWQHLNQPWFGASEEERIAAGIVLAMAVLGTLPINLSYWVEDHILPRIRSSPWFLPVLTTFWSLEILAIFVFYRDGANDFIYFQF